MCNTLKTEFNNVVLTFNFERAYNVELVNFENIDYLTKSNFEQNVKVFSIKPGINKVRVYIWMEGQDVDCEDKSAIGDVEFNFQFTTNPA